MQHLFQKKFLFHPHVVVKAAVVTARYMSQKVVDNFSPPLRPDMLIQRNRQKVFASLASSKLKKTLKLKYQKSCLMYGSMTIK